MTGSSEDAMVTAMNHPARRKATRDRIIDLEVWKLERLQAQGRVASARRVTNLPLQSAFAPELRRAA